MILSLTNKERRSVARKIIARYLGLYAHKRKAFIVAKANFSILKSFMDDWRGRRSSFQSAHVPIIAGLKRKATINSGVINRLDIILIKDWLMTRYIERIRAVWVIKQKDTIIELPD